MAVAIVGKVVLVLAVLAQLSECAVSTCSDAFNVTRPTAGEGPFSVGSTVTIEWTTAACASASTFVKVELCAYASGGNTTCYDSSARLSTAKSIYRNSGSESIIILKEPPTGGGYYQVKVIDDSDDSLFGTSDFVDFASSTYFTSVPSTDFFDGASASDCTVSVTKPTSTDGPIYIGGSIPIQWAESNCSAGQRFFGDFVNMELCGYRVGNTLECYTQSSGYTSAWLHLDDGSDSITLKSIPPVGTGYYRIKIVDTVLTDRYAISGYFEVRNATSSSTASVSSVASSASPTSSVSSMSSGCTSSESSSSSTWSGGGVFLVGLMCATCGCIIGALCTIIVMCFIQQQDEDEVRPMKAQKQKQRRKVAAEHDPEYGAPVPPSRGFPNTPENDKVEYIDPLSYVPERKW